MKDNNIALTSNKLSWAYITGFFLVLILPLISFFPWLFPSEFGKTILLRTIITLLWLIFLYQFLWQKNQLALISLKKNVLFWLMTALAGAYVLATVFSQDAYFSLFGSPPRAGGVVNFIFYGLFALLLFLVARKSDWQKIWDISFGVGVLVALIGILQFFQSGARPASTLGNTIFLAMYLSLLFFMAVGFALRQPRDYRKAFYVICAAIFLITIFITATRAVFLGITLAGLYFILFYSQKHIKIKLVAFLVVAIAGCSLFYFTATNNIPQFIQKNPTASSVINRISLKSLTSDERTDAWQIAFNAFKVKPIFGWGPENFSIAFDQFYNPQTIPYTHSQPFSDWWDRAHNIVLDIGVQAGIVGLLAYFSLFGFLLYKLQQAKKNPEHSFAVLHSMQAGLIAYLVANFFAFDSFATYFIFFLIIGYTLHIVYVKDFFATQQIPAKGFWKPVAFCGALLLAVIFLWQYNFVPLGVNAEINKAQDLATTKSCDQMQSNMDKALSSRTFLDAHARVQYISYLQTCATHYPDNDVAYAKKGVVVMREGIKIQPSYARFWLFLASFTNVIASYESDATKKTALLKEAEDYLEKVEQLAPNHQETLIEKTRIDMTAGDFQAAEKDAEACRSLNPNAPDCYFQLGLAQIYLRKAREAKENLDQATQKGYDFKVASVLNKLVDAYVAVNDYENLADTYRKLIRDISLTNPQYRASLAFVYRQLGEYDKARAEVKRFIELAPDQRAEAEAFLKTLPK